MFILFVVASLLHSLLVNLFAAIMFVTVATVCAKNGCSRRHETFSVDGHWL